MVFVRCLLPSACAPPAYADNADNADNVAREIKEIAAAQLKLKPKVCFLMPSSPVKSGKCARGITSHHDLSYLVRTTAEASSHRISVTSTVSVLCTMTIRSRVVGSWLLLLCLFVCLDQATVLGNHACPCQAPAQRTSLHHQHQPWYSCPDAFPRPTCPEPAPSSRTLAGHGGGDHHGCHDGSLHRAANSSHRRGKDPGQRCASDGTGSVRQDG